MPTLPVSAAFSSAPLSPADFVSSNCKKQSEVVRSTADFIPSIWGDQFLEYNEKDAFVVDEQVVEDLKEKVRKERMIKAYDESTQHLELLEVIDGVQRLGIAYHFEEEIEKALQHIYITYGDSWIENKNLKSISLWFRLLRQQGFNVSSGIFKNQMDQEGQFNESLSNDALGMLALYEAGYMRIEGEKVLDDALEFTKIHLGKIAKNPSYDPLLRTQIEQALKQPLRKRLQRLEALRFMPIYAQEANHNEALLKLAKLDYNMVQSMHKLELSQVCKWWKDLDMRNKLPFVRDRVIEGFFWILGIYYEPQHSRTRVFLIKSCMWIIVLDDRFDNYGTYEELELFTQAVERWSLSCLDDLPEYMHLIYQELLKRHLEMEEVLEKEGKAYHIHYIKEMAKEYTRNLLMEAKFVKDKYVPTIEEYMSVSLITAAYPLITVRSYVGQGDHVTEDTFKWIATHPPVVKASATVLRLMDDIGSHKFEQERDHVASCVECYEKEAGGSEEEAYEYFSKKVEDAWKVMNRATLRPTDVPVPVLMPAINLARVADAIYYGGRDSYSHAGSDMKYYIKSLFVNPVDV
ncbi:(E)-beta-farnesene synthase-like [Rutidosis leptorrhynchoides]|uniref:(E)-beta-farnesene synthase-like n=1 Tax=Rutidosis leptorrhynchoides TaxID=125765 RepID=UPI003A99D40D